MASPRLLKVRVNSETTDAFDPAQVYYGQDRHFERGDQHGHRTHTSVQLPEDFNTDRLLTGLQLHEPSSLPAFRRHSLGNPPQNLIVRRKLTSNL